jgi:hypothetical protein
VEAEAGRELGAEPQEPGSALRPHELPMAHKFFPNRPGAAPGHLQRLPQVLTVSGLTATTLNDVRVMIERHLPAASQAKEMWRYVSNQLREAALGGDTAEFCSVLEMALSLEGLEWTLK